MLSSRTPAIFLVESASVLTGPRSMAPPWGDSTSVQAKSLQLSGEGSA